MSTEFLYAMLGGEEAEIAKTYYPYYVDVIWPSAPRLMLRAKYMKV